MKYAYGALVKKYLEEKTEVPEENLSQCLSTNCTTRTAYYRTRASALTGPDFINYLDECSTLKVKTD